MPGTSETDGPDGEDARPPGHDTANRFGDQIERRVRQTRLAALFLQSPSFMAVTEGPEHAFVNANPNFYELVGGRDLIGRTAREAFPELEGEGFFALLDRVYETGEPYVGSEEPVPLRTSDGGERRTLHVSYSYHPLRDDDGDVAGILVHGIDVTERVEGRQRLRRRVRQQTAIAELGRTVLTQSSLAASLERIAETVVDALGARRGALYRHESDRGRLVLAARSGRAPDAESPRALPTDGDHVPGRAFTEGRPVLARASGGSGAPEPISTGTGGGTHLAVPVPGAESVPLGVLVVHGRDPDAFDEGDVPVLEAAAQLAGGAIGREESRRFSETVALNLPGLLYRCRNDPDWTMQFLSEGTRELTGYTPAELTGEDEPVFADLIHPDDRQRVWRRVQEAVERGTSFNLEYRLRTRDGEEKAVWEHGRGVRPETGAPFVLEGYVFDVTEWREAEQRARQLASVLRAAFRGYDDAVFIVDLPERTVAECNEAAEEMFGYPRDELVGESTLKLHVDREQYERFDEISGNQLRRGGSFRGEFRMRRRDGSTFPTEHSITFVETDSGEPDYSLSIVRDISERKQRQEELERSRKLLRRYARHLTTAQEEERAAVAREIHDELGQSLTALKLQLEELRNGNGDATARREKLEKSLELLRSTIGQVRDLSSSLRPSALDSLGLWESLAQLVRTFREQTGLSAEFDTSGSLGHVDPDRQIHVYRVVQEALTNVARHARAEHVRVDVRRRGEGWVVRVLDDGVGVEADPLEGTAGHGLVGMRERARLLGGDLDVAKRPEGGTEVRLRVDGEAADG